MKPRFSLFIALISVSLISPVFSADRYWKGGGTWATATNWSTTVDGAGATGFPVTGDNVFFNITSLTGDETISLGAANRAANSLTFNSPGATTILSGASPSARSLVIGAGGITMNAGAGAATIGNGASDGVSFRMSASHTWVNNSSSLLWVRNSVAPNTATTGPTTLTIDGTGNTTIVGAMNDTTTAPDTSVLTLVKNGTGTLDRISGNSSGYTGGTSLNGGTVIINNNNQLGAVTGTLTFNGGTLRASLPSSGTAIGMSRSTTLNALGGTFEVDAGVTVTQAGLISGAGALTKNGAGTLILGTFDNTYLGGTVVNGGVLQVATNGRLGPASTGVTLNGGTLRLSASFTTAAAERPITITANGGGIDVASGVTYRNDGVIDGAGMLTKTGAGTLYLVNAKTYGGGTAINGGVIQTFSDNRLGTAGSALSFDTGTLRAVGTFTINRPTTLNAGGGTFHVDVLTNTLTLSGPISGTGALNIAGPGTTEVTGVNSYTGPTNVNSGTLTVISGINSSTAINVTGTLKLGASNVLGDAAPVTLGAGGTLLTENFSDMLGALAVSGDSSINLTGQSIIQFATSSGETWNGALAISGWTGLATGGGTEQLKFGTDGTGLTAAQLAASSFINPLGFAPGVYSAIILPSGEIVPGALIPEVSTLLLGIIGGAGLILRRRR